MEKEYVEFSFNYEAPNYSDFDSLILNLKNKYTNRIEEIKKERTILLKDFSAKKTENFIDTYEKLINEIIVEVISFYSPLLKSWPIGIFWTGSFSRGSSRLSSDFDLGFTYPSNLKSKILPVEEQIYLALSEIFTKPRDVIHSVIASHLMKLEVPIGCSRPTVYRMIWNNNIMKEYEISPGLEPLMSRIYISDRSPEIFAEHLKKLITPQTCLYWTGDFKPLYGDNSVKSIFEKLNEKEMSFSKINNYKEDFNIMLDKQITFLRENTSLLNATKLTKVKDIKLQYKKIPLETVFTILALARRKLILNGKSLGPIKINEFALKEEVRNILGKELALELFDWTYKTLWQTIRLETIFEMKEIRFGVHSIAEIDSSFDEFYRSQYSDVKEDFCSSYNSFLEKLYLFLEEILLKLKFEESGNEI